MSKRKATSEAEQQPSAKVHIAESDAKFPCKALDEEEAGLIRRINGHIAVLEDQEKALAFYHPCRVRFRKTRTSHYTTPRFDPEQIAVDFDHLELPLFEFKIAALPPQHYTWSELATTISVLTKSGRLDLLKHIYQQIEDRIVMLGPLHKACIEVQKVLEVLSIPQPTNRFVPVVVPINATHLLGQKSRIEFTGGLAVQSYEAQMRTITRYLKNFEPASD